MSRIRKENISLGEYLKAIRIYHWPKNLLVFLPALTGHLLSAENFLSLLIIFFSLSFVASGMYLINDLLDINNDKKHPTKKNRLIASGSLPPKKAKIISMLLILMGLVSSFAVSPYGGILIFVYIVLVSVYSLYIKRVPFFEAFFLTLVYLLRIYIGLLVINESASQWLMIFSFFFFFFLVLVKRHAELLLHTESLEDDPTGRRYQIEDINLIQSLSVTSGLLSLLVFGLYIASPKGQGLYASPNYLWLVATLGLLWVIDVLVLTHKGKIHHDPMVHAIKNKISLGILSATIILFALSL